MASFSLTEKLAVTGAFLAVVAMVVGTEEEPGVLVTSKETVTALRTNPPPRPPAAPAAPAEVVTYEVVSEPVFTTQAPEPQYPPPPLASRVTTRGALPDEDRAPVAKPRSYGSSSPAPPANLR